MRLAARITDATLHGGSIVTGLPQVLIGDQPAARVDDTHACPMTDVKPHVGGIITTGEPTVIFGDRPAARIGDLCACGQAGAAGANVSPSYGVPMSDRDGDGSNDTVHIGPVTVGDSVKFIGHRTAEIEGDTLKFSPGLPHTGKTVGQEFQNEWQVTNGDFFSFKATTEVEFDTAEVANDNIPLADGHGRYGVGYNVGAGINAVAVGGEVQTYQKLNDDVAVEADWGGRLSWGAGISFGLQLYYDSNDGKLHFYYCFGLWDAIPIFGQLPITQFLPTIELSFAIGITSPPKPPEPNMIITGEATVIIGD